MSRPARKEVLSSNNGWDGDIDDNFRNLMEIVTAIANGASGSEYNGTGDLPSASSYDGCMTVVDLGSTWALYFSDGSTWKRIGHAADNADIGALTYSEGTAGGTQGSRAIPAQDGSIGALRNGFQTVASWCSELRQAMEDAGLIQ